MLNYGYAILASQITIKIIQNGLNPDIGLLHSDLDNRHSLTYDIIEEFRQQIVDKTIISMINNKQITTEDYQENLITLDKRKIIIEKILKKLENKIVYKNKEYTYDEIIDKQINNLKEIITKDTEYEGFYLNWWNLETYPHFHTNFKFPTNIYKRRHINIENKQKKKKSRLL